ncbi:MAG: hypothetical protein WBQ50_16030 [Nocardioides sp.]
MTTRVYVPSTMAGLRGLVAADGIGPAPFLGHAVTDALRADYAEGGEEEWEYAAALAASGSSLALIGVEGEPRRVVVAVDVDGVAELGDADDPSLVEVGEVVPFRRVAAVLVDLESTAEVVRAASAAWPEAEVGDEEALGVVERALDNDLAWYATQEIGDLLGLPG